LEVIAGAGDDTFVDGNVPVGSGPVSVAPGDVNGDGVPDLAVANQESNTVTLLLGQGDGSFHLGRHFLVGRSPSAVAMADVNGDSVPDLAVANQESTSVSLRLGRGDGTFQALPPVSVGGRPDALALGDVNGDGVVDVAVALSSLTGPSPTGVVILLGAGDGTFQVLPPVAVGSGPAAVAVGDVNGDGRVDLAVANNSSSDVSILLNTTP
jgi:hypothetical protein